MRNYLKIVVLVVLFLNLPLNVFAQCLTGDCSNGYGKFRYASGAIYEGNFVQGKCSGQGILYFSNGNKYLGTWDDNQREGRGKLIFTEGHTYLGGFHQSRMRGKGVMNYANGDKYEGNWRNDRPNGEGKYHFSNGERYEGNFVSGRFDGNGTMFYLDGSRYVGTWKDSEKHGTGSLYHYSGTVLNGEWANGNRLNSEIETSTLGNSNAKPSYNSASSSLARNCNSAYCLNGLGTYVYSDGSRYSGGFINGDPNGKGMVVYSNGDRYEGMWQNHAPHGKGIMYYRSGRVLGAIFSNGEVLKEIEPEEKFVGGKEVVPVKDNAVKIWSVVVGVGKYSHMPTLNYTDDDAYQIFAFLKSEQGGALPDEQVKVLIDENATRRNILTSLRETLQKADENDVVLFYFSGHGLEGSFLPVDYNGYNNRIRYDEIKTILDDSRAKHKLVFADACYSGGLLAAKSPNSEPVKIYLNAFDKTKGGTALLMSSKSEEVSLEDGGLRSGVFSHYLMRGLKGEADRDGNKIVTVTELFDFVQLKVKRYTSNAQNPTISGNFDKDMPVAVMK